MWVEIFQQLSTKLGREFNAQQPQQIYGGDINQSYRIYDSEDAFFIKINQRHLYPMFQAEARSLAAIAKAFGKNQCDFYDKEEFDKLISKYGEMKHFQTFGK